MGTERKRYEPRILWVSIEGCTPLGDDGDYIVFRVGLVERAIRLPYAQRTTHPAGALGERSHISIQRWRY
jgi:hypothetical protein